jgi:hypothetical protein
MDCRNYFNLLVAALVYSSRSSFGWYICPPSGVREKEDDGPHGEDDGRQGCATAHGPGALCIQRIFQNVSANMFSCVRYLSRGSKNYSTTQTSAILSGLADSTAAEFPAAEKGRELLSHEITRMSRVRVLRQHLQVTVISKPVILYARQEINIAIVHMSLREALRQSALVVYLCLST